MKATIYKYIRILILLSGLMTLPSCIFNNEDVAFEEDFEVGFDLDLENAIDETEYYEDLEKSSSSIRFESSFPVSFYAGSRFKTFDQIPLQALQPSQSRLVIQLDKSCHFYLETGPVMVVRFLYTGEWIKFNEVIAKSSIKLQKKQDLNFQMWSELVPRIPPRYSKGCWKKLYGRKTYLGRFHMHRSQARIIASPGSPRLRFARLKERGYEKVYIHWLKNAQYPTLKNEMDFPAVVKSSFFRTFVRNSGFYYLDFRPLLQIRKSKKRVIAIPPKKNSP